jgi:hypothetical protein
MHRAGNSTQPKRIALAEGTLAEMDGLLSAIPAGSNVAAISMLGSLCPITLGHVQCYVEARKLLLDLEGAPNRPPQLESFVECIGFVNLNPDTYVQSKLQRKGQKPLDKRTRAQLVRLATAELPWLRYSESPSQGLPAIKQRFPKLNFAEFDMNGADDVLKYNKWRGTGPRRRMIIMGRPGSTESVRKGMAFAKVAPEHCTLGPELPDISSTAARDASLHGDVSRLLTMLHPRVADYLLRSDGHAGVVPMTVAEDESKTEQSARPTCIAPNDDEVRNEEELQTAFE